MKAAAALACVLGLAACGGGGGGGGAGGGGGGPTPVPGYHLFENATSVTALNTVIAAHTPDATSSQLASSRLADNVTYGLAIGGDDPPRMSANSFDTSVAPVALERKHRRGNAAHFTDSYTAMSGTAYEGHILIFWDPDLPSGSFHRWGVWLRKQAGSGTWDEISTFNQFGDASYFQSNFGLLAPTTGMAAYTGGANGLYTKDGVAGWFSAETRLSVTFGGTDVAVADRFVMTGTIDSFVLSGNESVDWSVDLTAAPVKNPTTGAPTASEWNGTASGGETDMGAVSAQFWGTNVAGDQPGVMTGRFRADFSDGAVAGAFTARK